MGLVKVLLEGPSTQWDFERIQLHLQACVPFEPPNQGRCKHGSFQIPSTPYCHTLHASATLNLKSCIYLRTFLYKST